MRYYLWGFVPLVAVLAVLIVLGIDIFDVLLFTASFLWLFALGTPGIEERVGEKRYRLSFVRMIVGGDAFFRKQIKGRLPGFDRGIAWLFPLGFLGSVALVSEEGNVLYPLGGCCLFEALNQWTGMRP